MDEQLLIRFLTHTCTPEDLRTIDQWIAADKSHATWLFETERIWSLKDELRFSDKKEIGKAYERFILSQGENKNAGRHFYLSSVWKSVAAILIIGLLSLNLYQLVRPKTISENTIEVPKGQRVNLTLSDGTKVWLNSESKLVYPSSFSSGKRNLKLEGEAFFEVMRDEDVPFVVQSPLLVVKVLGTKFNLRAYHDEKSIVALVEGKVEVQTNNQENRLVLNPNERASYSKDSGLVLEKDINVDQVKSWIKGEGVFIQQRLDDIVHNLERKYNVKIVIEDPSLRAEIFTCRFTETATIEQVLLLLKKTRELDFSVEREYIRIFKPENK